MAETYYTIGMAGHIDHGKTTLTKALTNVDTDRLKEEKERAFPSNQAMRRSKRKMAPMFRLSMCLGMKNSSVK
nr:GTP-binding protein [Planococcus sp. 107-1]